METIFVQFTDSTKKSILSVFSCEQDPAVYPNQGTVTTNDPMWAEYYNAQQEIIRNLLPAPTSGT